MKELKNSLKKESCYTTILSTARIRGVEKIRLITHDDQEQEQEVMSKQCLSACPLSSHHGHSRLMTVI